MAHVPSRKAAAILGLHPNTLRSYANKGKIPHYRNSAGQRLYDVDSYLQGNREPGNRLLLPRQLPPAEGRSPKTGPVHAATFP